jgi:hypothetical protein
MGDRGSSGGGAMFGERGKFGDRAQVVNYEPRESSKIARGSSTTWGVVFRTFAIFIASRGSTSTFVWACNAKQSPFMRAWINAA